MKGEMSREALQAALDLLDRKSFRSRYLKPVLDEGWIEMILPGNPIAACRNIGLRRRVKE